MRLHAFRLAPGADLKAELAAVVAREKIGAGFIVTAVGSLALARLRMPGGAEEPDRFLELEEPTEILTLSGVLSPDGVHVHASLSRRDGSCVGGHVVSGCVVRTTAEVVVGDAPDLIFRRVLDPSTGYPEFSISRREPA